MPGSGDGTRGENRHPIQCCPTFWEIPKRRTSSCHRKLGRQDTRHLPARPEHGHSVRGQTGPGKAERRKSIPQRTKIDLRVHRYGVGIGSRPWGHESPGLRRISQTLSGVPHTPFHLKVAELGNPTPPSQGDTIPPNLHPDPLGVGVKGCPGGAPDHLGPEGAPLSRSQPSMRRGAVEGIPFVVPFLTLNMEK